MEKNSDTLELKTIIEVDKSMKLIDINGKKISFKSDCFVKPKNPNDIFKIAIVNQNDLDNGTINFENFNGKLFKRRVTYESEDGEHVNHYIAFKKMPTDVSENTISCEVIIRLTELDQSNPQPGHSSTQLHSKPELEQLHSKPELEQLQSKPELEQLHSKPELEQLHSKPELENSSSFYRNFGFFCLIITLLLYILKK